MGKHIFGSPHEETISKPADNLTGASVVPKASVVDNPPSQITQLGKDSFKGGDHPPISKAINNG